MLRAYYINLAEATARRRALEANLAGMAAKGLRQTRIEAVNSAEVRVAGVPGQLRDAEKGCFLSHHKALSAALANADHALILEDDVVLSRTMMDVCIATLPRQADNLDILYLDSCVIGLTDMTDLYLLKSQLMKVREIRSLPISNVQFAGSSAYIVMNGSKRKLLEMMARTSRLDVPFDLWLRQEIMGGRLRAALTVPFLATVSALSEMSQIQGNADGLNRLIWDAFRRLMFLDHDPEKDDALGRLRDIPADFYDKPATDFSQIVRLVCSVKFDS